MVCTDNIDRLMADLGKALRIPPEMLTVKDGVDATKPFRFDFDVDDPPPTPEPGPEPDGSIQVRDGR